MKARGFSLIELVVVMVIAAILAALAIPRFTDSESKATWYHEQVMAAVRFAQRQAVAQRRNVYVCVAGTSVSVSYDAACAGTPACPSGGSILQIPQQLCAPNNVTLSATTTPFSFNGLGQPSPVGGVGLTLTGHSITVTAETGYVFGN